MSGRCGVTWTVGEAAGTWRLGQREGPAGTLLQSCGHQ